MDKLLKPSIASSDVREIGILASKTNCLSWAKSSCFIVLLISYGKEQTLLQKKISKETKIW